jgi:hypothetical protein
LRKHAPEIVCLLIVAGLQSHLSFWVLPKERG